MILVTGGAGFIGSHVVEALNQRGHSEILVADRLDDPRKEANLRALKVADVMDKGELRRRLAANAFDAPIDAVLHQGACTDTLCDDEGHMTRNNVEDATALLHWSLARRIPFVYASSAAVYGAYPERGDRPLADARSASPLLPPRADRAKPDQHVLGPEEAPLNLYGRTKLAFDRHVRGLLDQAGSPVVGLRYFNVYGPREAHKGRMMSMPGQLLRQLRDKGECRLFEGSGGYGPGEQRRDFVFAGDVAEVNLHFAFGPMSRGLHPVGTGQARTFNEVARLLIQKAGGALRYIPFPKELEDRYQHFTQADLSSLREAGYARPFMPIEEGLSRLLAED